MTDFVEKSLRLTVQGENLASSVFDEISAEFDALARQAQETFDLISASAADSVDSIKASVGTVPAFWEDQLQAVADFAMTAFAEIADAAMVAADAVGGAAAPIQATWEAALGGLGAEAATAAAKIDTSLTGSFSAAAAAAEGDAGAMVDALGGVTSEASATADALKSIGGSTSESAGLVSDDAAKIVGSLTGIADDAKAAADNLASIGVSMAGAPAKIEGDAGKIVGSLDTMTGAADAFEKMLGDSVATAAALQKELAGVDATAAGVFGFPAAGEKGAKGAAGKTSGAGPGGVLPIGAGGKAGEDTLVKQWEGEFAAEEKAATKFFSAIKESATLARGAVKGLFADMKELGGKAIVPAIAAAITPTILEAGANFAEQLRQIELQTGLTGAQAAQFQQILGGASSSQGATAGATQILSTLQRFEKNLLSGTSQFNPLNPSEVYGTAGDLGYGRKGILPQSLTMGQPNEQLVHYLSYLHLNAQTLTHESAPKQLEDISAALTKFLAYEKTLGPKQEAWSINVAQGFARTAFGNAGGGGSATSANMLLFLEEYQAAVNANKGMPNYVAGSALDKGLDSGLATAIGAKEQAISLQQGFGVVMFDLIPALKAFTTGLAAFAKVISDIGHPDRMAKDIAKDFVPNSWQHGANDVLALWATTKAVKLGGKVAGVAGKVVSPIADATGASDLAAGIAEKLLPAGAGGLVEGIVSKLLGPIGVVAMTLYQADSVANDTGQFARAWQKNVAPHTNQKNFTQADTETAIIQAATALGVNVKAMLADSYAESGLSASARNKTSGALGAFQFMPKTWAADTKEVLGQSLPFSFAANPYDAAWIAAAEMRKSGTGTQTSDQPALADILKNFENPGGDFNNPKTGLGGDWARGIPFLNALGAGGSQASSVKTTDAEVEKLLKQHRTASVATVDGMLRDFVTSLQKNYPLVYNEHKKQFTAIEAYLKQQKDPFTKTGQELIQGLMQGLEQERGALLAEAQKIAAQLEATLRAALKTKSPSQMTWEIGRDLMLGMSLGMTDTLGATSSAAGTASASLAGALAGGATGSLRGLGAGAGGTPIINVYVSGNIAQSEAELGKRIAGAVAAEIFTKAKFQRSFGA